MSPPDPAPAARPRVEQEAGSGRAATKLFAAALALEEPWYVEREELDSERRVLVLHLSLSAGGDLKLKCGACGTAGCRPHDSSRLRWRHLDFIRFRTYIVAPAPRVACPSCGGIRHADLLWGRPKSEFTYPFEYRIAELASATSLKGAAELMDVPLDSLARVVGHYADPGTVPPDRSSSA